MLNSNIRFRIPLIVLTVVLAVGFLMFTAPWMPGAEAQKQKAPTTREQIRYSFAPVVRKVAPAVVNIYSRRVVERRRSPFFDDPFFRRFFGGGFGVPRRRVQKSLGSGVIVSPDGFIVTNHHVVRGGTEIQAILSTGREYQARIVLKDEKSDLAVLRIDAGNRLPFLQFHDSDDIQVGDLVLAIGNPFGIGQTVTSGIVSAPARSQSGISNFQFFIQTDAAINPGNSGGALVNIDGRLIGINTAIFSRSGGSNGIGFAVPANMVRLVVASARTGKIIKRPWLGARLQKLTPEISDALGVTNPRGALVQNVHPKGPAARAGLKRGDIVTGFDGKQIKSPQELNYRVATRPLGADVAITYLRGGSRGRTRLVLARPPETPRRNERRLSGRHPFGGALVANLSPAVAEELKLDSMAKGVVIIDVGQGIARRLRLRRGDIILDIEGDKVKSVKDLAALVRRPREEWVYRVRRGDRVLRARVGG
jgi:serine protease Do